MLNNTNLKANLMENVEILKAKIRENNNTINSLIPSIPSYAKGKTYNELCYIANRDGNTVNMVSTTIYNLKMANTSLAKAISSMENLINIL